MSICISATLKEKYPYWKFDEAQRIKIAKDLMPKYTGKGWTQQAFGTHCQAAVQVMKELRAEHEVAPEAQSLLKDLNSAARVLLDPTLVSSWQAHQGNVQILTGLVSWSAGMTLSCATVPAGMALLYFRSHKILAIANGCVVCALLALHSVCWKWRDVFIQFGQLIEDLSGNTFGQFEDEVLGLYEGLKKTNILIRLYLDAHQNRMTERKGTTLLGEQLFAISKMMPARSAASSEPVDVKKLLAFFTKFEKFCRKGMSLSGGVGACAVAWTYYAYQQKARLMVVAGAVWVVGSAFFTAEFVVLRRGSKKIGAATNEQVEKAFRGMAIQSVVLGWLGLREAKVAEIQQAFVIPFDAILTLIPGWKRPVQGTTGA